MSEAESTAEPLPYECGGNRDVRGPYTSVCPRRGCAWYGKDSMTVYDGNGIPVCVVPRLHHWDRDKKVAKDIARALAEVLNAHGFGYEVGK